MHFADIAFQAKNDEILERRYWFDGRLKLDLANAVHLAYGFTIDFEEFALFIKEDILEANVYFIWIKIP